MITTRSLSGGATSRVLATAQAIELRRQQLQGQYPHFRHASITPVPASQPRYYAGAMADPAFFRR
jgi:hypothetical protein